MKRLSLTMEVVGPQTSSCSVEWFRGVPWLEIPCGMAGDLQPGAVRSRPRLIGGSSKLAKLAEERRKKAASSQTAPTVPDGALSSLDRLSKPKDIKENEPPQIKTQPKAYPIRKKKEPSPPPRDPTPPPVVDEAEQLPDLRASPTAFARTLSTSPSNAEKMNAIALKHTLGISKSQASFNEPSPDDTVLRAQQRSKSLNK